MLRLICKNQFFGGWKMEFNPKYFEWMTPWENIFEVISERKKVGDFEGICFIIHPNEQGHNKGHLHAKYQGKEVVISIPEGEVISGNIPKTKQRMASEWVVDNSDFLIKQWNEITNGIKIPAL